MLPVSICAGEGPLGIEWTSLFWATTSLLSPQNCLFDSVGKLSAKDVRGADPVSGHSMLRDTFFYFSL
jgi:hypothetical protein